MEAIVTFIVSHFLEIVLSIVSVCAIGYAKHAYDQKKRFERFLEQEKQAKIEESIDSKVQPILDEIEELRTYIRNTEVTEKSHMNLIISSYRFRLVQLCKEYIRQGYITQSQYDQLVEFFRVYSGLGGNGQAQEFYNRAIALDIRPE